MVAVPSQPVLFAALMLTSAGLFAQGGPCKVRVHVSNNYGLPGQAAVSVTDNSGKSWRVKADEVFGTSCGRLTIPPSP